MTGRSPRNIETLVDEQVRRWRLAQQKRRSSDRPPGQGPVIAISREFGAQASAIGEAVAHKLSFSFWDQQIVHAIAERSGAPEEVTASLDEHARSALEDLLAASLSGEKGTEYNYVRQLRRVIQTIHRQGHAVIIGRGAQFILSPEVCLRVRVIWPLERRAAAYAEREGLSFEEAQSQVSQVERDRRRFIRLYFEREVTDENHYDLIINRDHFSIDAAADLVVAAYHSKFPHARVAPSPRVPQEARSSSDATR